MKCAVLFGLVLVFSSCDSHDVLMKGVPAGTGIIGGDLVEEKVAMAAGIVAVMNDEKGTICTGTLIGPNVVLTAAHCVYRNKPHLVRVVFGVSVDSLLFVREPDILKEYVRTVRSIVVHPDYNPEKHESEEWDWSDIAVIRFRDVHPSEFQPAKLLPDTKWLKVGDLVQMFGYGVSELTTSEVDPSHVEDLEEAFEWGQIVCDDMEKLTGCMEVNSTGEGDLRHTKAAIKEIRSQEVVLDEAHGQSSCVGDSGGPVFLERSGEMYLFGVTSRGGALCNDFGVYTNVSEFRDWIAKTIESMDQKK